MTNEIEQGIKTAESNNVNIKKISIFSSLLIGVGAMICGSIFAAMGVAASIAHESVPVALLLGGFIALITSYSYLRLSLFFPNRGGTVKFINLAFGESVFSGTLNVLLMESYIIMLAYLCICVWCLFGSFNFKQSRRIFIF